MTFPFTFKNGSPALETKLQLSTTLSLLQIQLILAAGTSGVGSLAMSEGGKPRGGRKGVGERKEEEGGGRGRSR